MRSATMSIMGLYEWDQTIFDLLQLPQGLDKDKLIMMILAECSDLEVLYPNPEVMKNLIGVWSYSSQYSWEKLYNTLYLEYNPIDNYDRTETRTNTSAAAGNSTDSGTDTATSTDSGTDTTAIDSTRTEEVAGFESTSADPFTDKNKETIDSDTTTTYGKTNTNSMRYGKVNNNTYNKTDTESIRARGNIGTVTTQSMIEEERNIAAFNLFERITDEFKQRYCLLVY